MTPLGIERRSAQRRPPARLEMAVEPPPKHARKDLRNPMAEVHAENRKHPYHLVDPSPWPVVGAVAAGTLAAGGVLYMHDIKPFGLPAWIVLPIGAILVLGT